MRALASLSCRSRWLDLCARLLCSFCLISQRRIEAFMTTVHLIAGGSGAGKSTFARRLAGIENAVHLSIDDWMVMLYGPDAMLFLEVV